jgi:hypothetical protein
MRLRLALLRSTSQSTFWRPAAVGISLAVLAVIGSPAYALEYVWTAGGHVDSSYIGLNASLYPGFNPTPENPDSTLESTDWHDRDGAFLSNWQRSDNGPPFGPFTANDTLIFRNVEGSNHLQPSARQDFTIGALLIERDREMILDSAVNDGGVLRRALLTIASGDITIMRADAGGLVPLKTIIGLDLHLGPGAVWKEDGRFSYGYSRFDIRGNVSGSDLHIENLPNTNLYGSEINLSGKLSTVAPLVTRYSGSTQVGEIEVMDSATMVLHQQTVPSASTDLTLSSTTHYISDSSQFISLATWGNTFNDLRMDAIQSRPLLEIQGPLSVASVSFTQQPQIKEIAPLIQYAAGAPVDGNSYLSIASNPIDGFSRISFPAAALHGAGSFQNAGIINVPIHADKLLIEGAESTSALARALQLSGTGSNQINETVIKSTTLVLNRVDAPDSLRDVTIGYEGVRGKLYSLQGHQIKDDATVTINPDSFWEISGESPESVGELVINGGVLQGTRSFYFGPVTSSAPTIGLQNARVTAHSGAGQINGNLHAGSAMTFEVSGGASLLLDGTSNSPGVSKLGAGNLILGPNARLTGPVNISAGTVTNNASNLVAFNSEVTISNATWDLKGQSEAIASLALTSSSLTTTNGARGTLRLPSDIDSSIALNGNNQINANLDAASRILSLQTESGRVTTYSGEVTAGALIKGGGGTLTLSDATLPDTNLFGGTIRAANAPSTIRGLFGNAGVVQADSTLYIDAPAELAAQQYTGSLAGAGLLSLGGAGLDMTLGGSTPSTLSFMEVTNGTLRLSKPAGTNAVGGVLGIGSGATLVTNSSNQFGSTVDVQIEGQTQFGATSQTFRHLSIRGADTNLAFVRAHDGIAVQNGSLTGRAIISGSGLDLTASQARISGTVFGESTIDNQSTLEVLDVESAGVDLSFGNRLLASSGSTISFDFDSTVTGPLLTVGGGLLAGTPNVITIGGVPTFTQMTGSINIDLSSIEALSNRTYDLIDFSAAPYTLPGVSGSHYPRLSNFVLASPPGVGHLQISGNILQYVQAQITAADADYNDDGVVDAADYVVWRDLSGSSGVGLAADGDGNGTVDQADYDIWRSNYGRSVGTGSAASSNVLVPEPTTMLMLIAGVAMASCGRRSV